MRDPSDHEPGPPPGPEVLSLTVLLLAAALVVAAMSYSSVVGKADRHLDPPGTPCPTVAGCEGSRGISPGPRRPPL